MGITTLGQNPNNTSDCRLATKLAVNRENVKKELTHGIEHVAQKKNLVETFSTIQGKQSCKEENKPSSTSCSTDEIGIGINESRTVRFRNNLFVVSKF